MLKHLHLLFVLLAASGFFARLYAAEFKPALLQEKWLKIAPHALASLMILTGIGLVFQGNWLDGEFGWIVAKIIGLVAYIGLGVVAMRSEGQKRRQFAAATLLCLLYIGSVAVSKNIFIFF